MFVPCGGEVCGLLEDKLYRNGVCSEGVHCLAEGGDRVGLVPMPPFLPYPEDVKVFVLVGWVAYVVE